MTFPTRSQNQSQQTGLIPRQMSLNTATLGNQWDLGKCIDACERYGFGGIAPWRKDVQQYGVSKSAAISKLPG